MKSVGGLRKLWHRNPASCNYLRTKCTRARCHRGSLESRRFAIPVPPLGKSGIHKTQVVVQKHDPELSVPQNLQRFSRGLGDHDIGNALLEPKNSLESYGVGFRSFTEPYFDSCGLFKEAVVSIVATLAKQERVQIAERTRAGLARVKASGRVLGRPKHINRVHAAEYRRLRAQGLSLRAIGRRLGISEGSVRRLASHAA